MIHYTCDRCRRQINTVHQTRYVVQIDIQVAQDGTNCEFEDDIDHLSELHQILEGISEEEELACVAPETSHRGQYDLCPECHEQFLRNPLGRDAVSTTLGFSNN